MISRLLGAVFASVLLTVTADAAVLPLESRLGGLAYYDPNLDITWLADMDLAYSQNFSISGVTTNMGGFTAQEYIIAMNDYGGGVGWLGITNWRLPTTLYPDTSCTDLGGTPYGGATATGYNCIGGELGFLYYEELGGTAGGSLPGLGGIAPDLSLFTKDSAVAPDYWTSPEIQGGSNPVAILFSFDRGYQSPCHYDCGALVWAVTDGDATVVPVPAALYLFGSGLVGLLGVARRWIS